MAGLAAALIVAVTGTALFLNTSHQSTSQAQAEEIDALGDVARWTLRVDAQPDVRRVELASATGSAVSGSLVFSPTSTELVVVAEHLDPAAAGHEYRCWVEVDGRLTPIGKMFFGGSLAYWVGDVPQVAGLAPGAKFGVSLVELGTTGAPGQPVLAGERSHQRFSCESWCGDACRERLPQAGLHGSDRGGTARHSLSGRTEA